MNHSFNRISHRLRTIVSIGFPTIYWDNNTQQHQQHQQHQHGHLHFPATVRKKKKKNGRRARQVRQVARPSEVLRNNISNASQHGHLGTKSPGAWEKNKTSLVVSKTQLLYWWYVGWLISGGLWILTWHYRRWKPMSSSGKINKNMNLRFTKAYPVGVQNLHDQLRLKKQCPSVCVCSGKDVLFRLWGSNHQYSSMSSKSRGLFEYWNNQ